MLAVFGRARDREEQAEEAQVHHFPWVHQETVEVDQGLLPSKWITVGRLAKTFESQVSRWKPRKTTSSRMYDMDGKCKSAVA